MNEQTEEKVQDILLSLVEFDGNMEKGFGTTVNVSKAQEDIISLIQKEREDAMIGGMLEELYALEDDIESNRKDEVLKKGLLIDLDSESQLALKILNYAIESLKTKGGEK